MSMPGGLDLQTADRLIENVIGVHPLPLGVAVNFLINGKEYIVPMAIEEPSVVAAASYSAKLARDGGGFTARSDAPVMIGQIQLVGVKDPEMAVEAIVKAKGQIIDEVNREDPNSIVRFGGGLKDIEARVLETKRGKMLAVHLAVDVRDAMGANTVDTIAEKLSPKFEELSGGQSRLRIITNLAIYRKAYAKAVWKKEALGRSTKGAFSGDEVVERILDAYAFAEADPFRCATHNKGIMNGIDAVAIATGNDWRAVEAGAHAYAATHLGRYSPLTRYYKNEDGDLVGEIELPAAVASFGAAASTHPLASIARKILGITRATELSEVVAAVGLAQNLAALRALATEGIQKGHMRLHARSIAIMAGATGDLIDRVAKRIADEKNVRLDRAKKVLQELTTNEQSTS